MKINNNTLANKIYSLAFILTIVSFATCLIISFFSTNVSLSLYPLFFAGLFSLAGLFVKYYYTIKELAKKWKYLAVIFLTGIIGAFAHSMAQKYVLDLTSIDPQYFQNSIIVFTLVATIIIWLCIITFLVFLFWLSYCIIMPLHIILAWLMSKEYSYKQAVKSFGIIFLFVILFYTANKSFQIPYTNSAESIAKYTIIGLDFYQKGNNSECFAMNSDRHIIATMKNGKIIFKKI